MFEVSSESSKRPKLEAGQDHGDGVAGSSRSGKGGGNQKESSPLPMLLRIPGYESFKERERYPHSAHRYFEGYSMDPNRSSVEDPYAGVIVWAKMPGHPYWPARLATEEEIADLWTGKQPDLSGVPQSLEEDTPGAKPTDTLMLYFYGAHCLGLVKRNSVEPFLKTYKDHSKNSQKQFKLALEEVDGEAMRNHFVDGVGSCMGCGGTENPENIILCDRCNSEAHMRCLVPKIHEIPADDWLCPICAKEAPLTYEAFLAQKAKKPSWRASLPVDEDDEEDSRPSNGGKLGWTPTEDRVLLEELFANEGSWEVAASKLPGRTPASCKNRHTVLYRKGHAPGYAFFSGKDPTKTLTREQLDMYISRIGGAPFSKEDDDDIMQEPSIASTKPKRATNAVVSYEPSSQSTKETGNDSSSSAGPGAEPKKKLSSGGNNKSSSSSSSSMPIRKASSTTNNSGATSQIAQMLHEALRIRKRSANDSLSSSLTSCFVCNLPNADVFCADEHCDRAFHAFCLGEAGPQKANKDKPWFCPWHYCAVCRLSEKDSTKEPVLLPEFYDGPPPLADLAGSVRLKRFEETKEEKSTAIRLIRCCSCPVALCSKHIDVKSEVSMDGGKPRAEIPLERRPVTGLSAASTIEFFGCERCAGISVAPPPSPEVSSASSPTPPPKRQSTSMFATANSSSSLSVSPGMLRFVRQLPRVASCRVMDKIVSEIAVRHAHLFALLIQAPSREVITSCAGTQAVDAFFAAAGSSRPLSLAQVQRKVRRLEYDSPQELKSDVAWMSEHLALVYERRHPRLAEACRSLPYCLNELLLERARDLVLAMETTQQKSVEEDFKQIFEESARNGKKESVLSGLMPFESYERNVVETLNVEQAVADWDNKVYLDREKTVDGGKTTLGLLVQALESAKLIPGSVANSASAESELLTPSRQDLDDLLETHSSQLRAALRTVAEIRSEVHKLFSVLDDTVGDEASQMLTIGGTRMVAEREAANRSLQAKLDETRQALEMERKARMELERRLAAAESSPSKTPKTKQQGKTSS